MKFPALFVFSAVILLTSIAFSDDTPSVRAQIQPSKAKLGDLLALDIEVRYPNGFTVDPPAFQKGLGTFEVYATTALPVQVDGAFSVARFHAQLQNFTTGPQLLPGVALVYRDLRGREQSLKTPELPVTIEGIAPGPGDKPDALRGIKGVYGPVGWSPWWWIAIVIVLVAGGVALWHRRQRVLHGPPPLPPVPPDVEALDQLEKLRATGWIEAGKMKEFYSGLSDIVRGYLERGFRVPALERTTNELMRDLTRRGDLDDVKTSLRELFEGCDLVKFAKLRPEAAEALKDHALALQVIHETRGLLRPSKEPA